MLKFGKPSQRGPVSGSPESRRAKRLSTNLISCELGEILDISKTGMRVACSGKPPIKDGQVVQMQLSANGQSLPIQGRIVWVRRRGLRTYQLGIHFVNVRSGIAAAVESLAKWGFVDLDAARKTEQKKSGKDESVRATMDIPDYYDVLNVKSVASQREIKQAYRVLAMKYHPDVAQGVENEDLFIRINEAYEVLSDPKSRRSYDTRVAEQRQRGG